MFSYFKLLGSHYIYIYIYIYSDRASQYICVIKTNLMYYLSSVYFVSQPLHVSGIFVAHRQEVYYRYIYTTIDTLTVCWPANRLSMYQLYIYSIPPDDGLQICLKHVDVD
jgi:hypothetical protein